MALYTLSDPIPKRAKTCHLCHRTFKVGEELISSLSESARSDYCSKCWKDNRGEGASVWHVTVCEPKRENKQRFVDLFDRALALLDRYLEEKDPKAYMLALYLQRQGALHRLRAKRSKKNIALFEVVETRATLAIPINDRAPKGTIEEDLMRALTSDGA